MNIKIDDKLSNYIESLLYEKNRTNEIVAFMLSHDYDMNTDAFKKWNYDNQEVYIKYQEAIHELETRYIKNNAKFNNKHIKWHLNFDTKMIEVCVIDAEKD